MTLCPLPHRDDRPRDSVDGLLACTGCVQRLHNAVTDLPALHHALSDELAGTWHDRVSDDKWPLSIAENPLPIRPEVADHRTRVHAVLGSWVLMLIEETGDHWPGETVRHLADYLERRHDTCMAAPWIEDYAAEIGELVRTARALLDPQRTRRVPCGPCPTDVEGAALPGAEWPVACPGTLVVRIVGETAHDPACDSCGHVTTIDHHAALRRGLAALVTAQDAAVRLGIAVGTIGSWATRGQVQRRGKDARGRTLYALSDLERLAA